MKKIIILMSLALISLAGCRNTSSQGGIAPVNNEFSITVPSSTTIKQGNEQTINVLLNRGADFKQDVELDMQANGISLTPGRIVVRASDSPNVKVKIWAANNASLGNYTVSFTATPRNGRPTTTTGTVQVIAE